MNPEERTDSNVRTVRLTPHRRIRPCGPVLGRFLALSPNGLKHLARDFSEIISVDGWGNRVAWLAIFVGLRRTPVPHFRWHPLHILAVRNNKDWPIVTWIVARK